MNVAIMACFSQDQDASDIALNSLDFVVLASVDIRTSGHTSANYDVRGLDVVQGIMDLTLLFHPHVGAVETSALLTQQRFEVSSNPPPGAPN